MPQFDFTRYRWSEDKTAPGRFKREIGGGELIEDVWNSLNQGEQNLFLGVYVQCSKSLQGTTFIDLARKAWISLRWDVPTIASQILHEPREGSPLPTSFLIYTTPSNHAEVEAWADKTVLLKEGVTDLDKLRYEIGHVMLPDRDLTPQTFLYCVPFSDTTFGFLLHTSHVPFDGAGVKILMTKFLTHLSSYISDPQYQVEQVKCFKWGTESDRLLPIVSDIPRKYEPAEFDANGNMLKAETVKENREGPEYDQTLSEVLKDLAKGGSIAHPFKSLKIPAYDKTKDIPSSRRAAFTFSVEQSKNILDACRAAQDRLTVNHLAHGSLSFLTILDNPPAPDSTDVVFYYGLVDSRHRLEKEYRGALNYPGYCLAMSSIHIPVNIAKKYEGGIEENIKPIILDFASEVKKEYKRQADLKSHLIIVNQQVDLMLSSPPTPPWRGPWFAGDGRGAIYLHPIYTFEGETIIEVTDFFVGLNKTDPGPFFRATEWNGRIMLSADYNEKAVDTTVVEAWMKKWAELMLSIV